MTRSLSSFTPLLVPADVAAPVAGMTPRSLIEWARRGVVPCVRPSHLLSGTQADNIADRQARGRHRPGRLYGEDHPAHKLTAEDVREIRAARRNGYVLSELATVYGVSRRTIYMAATGQTWRHLGHGMTRATPALAGRGGA